MADEQPQAPQSGQPEKPKAPVTPDTGQATDKQAAPSENKFAGKSPEELAKAYSELEKKLGDSSNELGELRKFREQMDVVLQAIWADQDVYNSVDKKIKEIRGVPVENGQTQTNVEGSPQITSPVDTDTRRALEAQIIDQFERRYGLDGLDPTKRREEHTKLGTALAEMLDPGGTKTYQEILNSVSLARLPKYLENAFFLANRDELIEKEKLKALTQNRENEGAAIGSLPSSSGSASNLSLTAAEKEAASKMKISEDKYLERKKQIAEDIAKGD